MGLISFLIQENYMLRNEGSVSIPLTWFCLSTTMMQQNYGTVKPVCNDHLWNKIYYLWFIQ